VGCICRSGSARVRVVRGNHVSWLLGSCDMTSTRCPPPTDLGEGGVVLKIDSITHVVTLRSEEDRTAVEDEREHNYYIVCPAIGVRRLSFDTPNSPHCTRARPSTQ
jgi:hypothetical protein